PSPAGTCAGTGPGSAPGHPTPRASGCPPGPASSSPPATPRGTPGSAQGAGRGCSGPICTTAKLGSSATHLFWTRHPFSCQPAPNASAHCLADQDEADDDQEDGKGEIVVKPPKGAGKRVADPACAGDADDGRRPQVGVRLVNAQAHQP